MKIDSLSASRYNLYDWCEFKYYLQYDLGFDDESGPAAVLGHIGHKVPEVLSKASIVKHDPNSKIWNVDYLWNIVFNHYYHNAPEVTERIKNDKLKKMCRGMHDLLSGDYTPIRSNTIDVERAFYLPITEPGFALKREDNGEMRYLKLSGRIDRVDQLDEETIEIVDYKTGTRSDYETKDRAKKDSISLHKEIQPRMYHLAATQLYPWAKNFLVTFIYITDGGPVTIPFCEDDIPETKRLIHKRLRAIQSNDDPQRNLTWKCKIMCPHNASGDCDKVWQEIKDFGHDFVKDKYTILNIKKYRK